MDISVEEQKGTIRKKGNFYTHQYIEQGKFIDRKAKRNSCYSTTKNRNHYLISMNNSCNIFTAKHGVHLKFYNRHNSG